MNLKKYLYFVMLAAAVSVAATSCEKEADDSDIIFGGGGNSGGNTGGDDDPADIPPTSNSAYLSRMEVPAMLPGNLFIQHSTKEGNDSVMSYCFEFSVKDYHSRWVAFRFDSKTRSKTTGRSDEFVDDPSLPSKYYIGSGGFGTGYDRGHLCASADRLYSVAANKQTFYMTNMSPQMSRFNQDYWVAYEGFVQNLGRSTSFSDTLYVVKGGTLTDGKTMGTISRSGKKVTIPKYYYMALLRVKSKTYEAMAFLMEHKDYHVDQAGNVSTSEMRTKCVTIDSLEKFTGIDFFPNLPDAAETAVESKVNYSIWGL